MEAKEKWISDTFESIDSIQKAEANHFLFEKVIQRLNNRSIKTNTMDNSKFLKIVIVVLLLLNTGTLAFMWTNNHRMGPPPPPPHERQDVFEFLTHELKFNDEQRNQYDQLRKEHHKAVEAMQE